MNPRARNVFYVGAIVGLAAFLVLALVPRQPAEETSAERAHRIASELRCPFCNGESIAEAQSSIGSDLRDLIAEQVDSGMSDDEIIAFYVDRYTERILLSPPWFGWGAVLWALPLAAASAGAVALARRRRTEAGPTRRFASDAAKGEAIAVAMSDISELSHQEAAGEVDEATAEELRHAYRQEIDQLEEAAVVAPPPEGRSRARVLVGAGILVVGAAALTAGVAATIRDRAPDELITGQAGLAGDQTGRDLSTVTNEELEAVVAANPDVIPMRLALARRYFTESNYSDALPHYLEVLNRERHPEALANVGWMAYRSGEVETGLSFVEESLELTRELPLVHWYLANIRYWGMEDAAGAVEPLEALLAFEDIPDEVRALASDLLDEVKAQL